jgi:Tfp pilus assembly protein PilN
MGLAFLAGGLIAGMIFLWFQSRISDQQMRNTVLQSEIKRLEGQIKEIAGLESEIAALRARQQAVEDLQSDRNVPVHLMTELVKQFPDGVYISSMRQERQGVLLQGVAQSNERVSELLRNLANNSDWLTRPELVEIVASLWLLGPGAAPCFQFQYPRPADACHRSQGRRVCTGLCITRARRVRREDLTPWPPDHCPRLTLPRCRSRSWGSSGA